MVRDPLGRSCSTHNATHYSERATSRPPVALLLPSRSGDFRGEVAVLLFNAFTKPEANVAADLDRRANFALGFLERLRHAFLVVVNIDLLKQRHFLVKSLEARLDDLLDHVRRFTLLLELVGEYILLALDHRRIESRRIKRLRVRRRDVHREETAKRSEFVGLARRFQANQNADASQTVSYCAVHVRTDDALSDR